MANYDIQVPDDQNDTDAPKDDRKNKRRKPDESELPTWKQPDAASAVAPIGSSGSYMVMPIGADQPAQIATPPQGAPQAGPQGAPTGDMQSASPMGDNYFHPGAPQGTNMQDVQSTPLLAEYQRKLEELHRRETDPVKKENILKAMLKTGAAALAQAPIGTDSYSLASQVGQGLGGLVSGAVDRRLPGKIQKLYDVQKLQGDVATAEKGANIESQMQRRQDLTSLGVKAGDRSQQRVLLAQDKARIDANYKSWLMQHGDKIADTAESRLKFAKEMGVRSADERELHDRWLEAHGDKMATETSRHNKVAEKIANDRAANEKLRTQIYKQSVNQQGDKIKAGSDADGHIAKALEQQNSDYEALISGLDPTDDAAEINKLQAAIIANQKFIAEHTQGSAAQPDASKAPDLSQFKSADEFRAYYSNLRPKPTPNQITRAVNAWIQQHQPAK